MRSTDLANLTCAQICREKYRGRKMFSISGAVGSSSGGFKAKRGGFTSTRLRSKEIPFFDEMNYGTVNFYKYIDIFLHVRAECDPGTDPFFLGINPHAHNVRQFFKRMGFEKTPSSRYTAIVSMHRELAGLMQRTGSLRMAYRELRPLCCLRLNNPTFPSR